MAVVVLLIATGGYTQGVLLDTEVATANVDGDGRETSVGNDRTNPVGVCLGNLGNTQCDMGMPGLFPHGVLESPLAAVAELTHP